ncbi:MAG: cell division topological specificity factor MinE [Clostridia bacterium]|nr:cell division topological specificity factor MinE [Clostridia bacterium]MBR4260352.1 cell division topological specificity factor MinE [Clostridia bacterium]
MLENFATFMKKKNKKEQNDKSKNAAKERLHLVLMQDRANVSADFLEMMKMEIVDVIKKYIDVDETDMDVKLENRVNEDGTSGAPALYANIPIVGINEEKKKESVEIGKSKQQETEESKKVVKKTEKKKVSSKKATTTKAAKTPKTSKTTKTTRTKKAADSKTRKTAESEE